MQPSEKKVAAALVAVNMYLQQEMEWAEAADPLVPPDLLQTAFSTEPSLPSNQGAGE